MTKKYGLFTNRKLQFLLFWILSLIIYLPTYHGGFYEDFQGIITRDRGLGLIDYIFREDRRVADLYIGNFTVNYILYKSFGVNPIPWYIVFSTLHALNAIIIASCFRKLFNWFGWQNNASCVLVGVLFWLLSPIHVETINWKACVHYLIAVSLLFLTLSFFLDYLKNGKKHQLVAILLCYTLSTLFWEIFYITPFICLLLTWFSFNNLAPVSGFIAKRGTLVFVLLLLLFGLYYFALIQYSNRYIPRVDKAAFQNITFKVSAFKFCGYFCYIYFGEYLLPASVRAGFLSLLHTTAFQIVFLAPIAILIITGLFKIKSISQRKRLLLFLLLCAIGGVCILIPMPYPELFPYSGGRYFYPASAFFYMLLAGLIFNCIKNTKYKLTVISLYLVFSLYGMARMTRNVYHSNKIFYGLMDNFDYSDKDTVVLLNLPASIRGIGLMGTDKGGNIGIHTGMLRNRKNSCKEYNVSGYNMVSRWDGAHVTVINDTTIKVTLNQYGSWWWYEGFGAYDYTCDLYSVRFIENDFSYILTFKHRLSGNTVVLFQKDAHWHKVDMERYNEEQW